MLGKFISKYFLECTSNYSHKFTWGNLSLSIITHKSKMKINMQSPPLSGSRTASSPKRKHQAPEAAVRHLPSLSPTASNTYCLSRSVYSGYFRQMESNNTWPTLFSGPGSRLISCDKGFPGGLAVQNLQGTWVQSLGQEDPRKKGMETHSSILAREFPGGV